MKPILGYWDVRGRANTIRMLLHYVGGEFEDKRYTDFQEWFEQDKIKLQGTLDFPNLPYYIDDTVKLTQTRAILTYLGRKHKLDGENEQERNRVVLIIEQLTDMMSQVTRIAYPANVDNRQAVHDVERKEYLSSLHDKLTAIVKFLGDNTWIIGSRVTYADFIAYDILDFHRRLFLPKHINQFPTIVAYLERFEGLKGVKEYLNSDAFKPLPIFGPFAAFGSKEDYTPSD